MAILESIGDVQPDAVVDTLCTVCAEFLEVSGAGVLLMTETTERGPLGASSESAAEIDRLQFLLGEGPSLDAWRLGAAVVEPNLGRPSRIRWPAFAGPALAAGAAALYAFPLRIGGVRFGALTAHRDRPGHLSDEHYADGAALANLVTQTILGLQALVPVGTLAVEFDDLETLSAVIHQATGIASVQLDLSLTESLVVLRATAYGSERRLVEVARDVVAGRLRLDGR